MISFHTSPLVQPGSGDSGGMNVYVREVASALAQAGVRVHDLHPRRSARAAARGARRARPPGRARPGRSVRRSQGGAARPRSTSSPPACAAHLRDRGGVDVIHGNYWLSGVVGHRLKHDLDVPLVSTFHTLARVKAEGGDLEPAWRDRAEAEIIALQRRDLRRAAPRRSASSAGSTATRRGQHRDRAAGRRARLLRARRPAGRPSGGRAAGRSADACCSSGGSSR